MDVIYRSYKMKISQFRFLVLLTAIFHLLPCGVMVQAQTLNKNWTKLVPTVLFFGDSILDTGNNNQRIIFTRANFPPYGRDFVGKKATGRFSNAKIIPDIIGTKNKYICCTCIITYLQVATYKI
jgi:hypothetical protein